MCTVRQKALEAQQHKEQRSELFDLCRYLHRCSQMRVMGGPFMSLSL